MAPGVRTGECDWRYQLPITPHFLAVIGWIVASSVRGSLVACPVRPMHREKARLLPQETAENHEVARSSKVWHRTP